LPHHTPLIATIAAAFVLALAFGFLAARLRVPPLVGYLLAGIALGPFTPGLVADADLAAQLADVGVILLMFGVGLHFSFGDLFKMRRVALPGALVQMAVATALGAALAMFWGWGVGAAVVFGLALSVASTVVLLQALEGRNALSSPEGHIAMGWLIVEDLAMVIVLVIVPILAAQDAQEASIASLTEALALVLAKIVIFGVVALYVGTRFVPWLLMKVTRTGSRELFTLAVLAIALGIAYGSAEAFDVSFALGAFFAGVVLSESALSKRAAADSLPLKDAFAVLFFVSVGMLFDPSMLIRTPLELLAVVAVILFGKAFAAYAIMRAFRFPPRTALTVSASLAQIGEFSFILAGLASSLGLLPTQGRDLILASAILSIALNPLLFALIPPLAQWLDPLPAPEDEKSLGTGPAAETQRIPDGHTVIVGFGGVGSVVGSVLEKAGLSFTVIENDLHVCEALRARNVLVVHGDALDSSTLESAGIAGARLLILAIPDTLQAQSILEAASRINPGIVTTVRTDNESEATRLQRAGASLAVLGDRELALTMANYALACYGMPQSARVDLTRMSPQSSARGTG
jgi:CPA2 family monovalent cation:H+ antiporter-2